MEQLDTDITVSEASASDSPGIVKVIKDTWLSTYPNSDYDITTEDILSRFATRGEEERAKRLAENLRNPMVKAWVAHHKGGVVGVCMVEKKEPRNYVGATYILADFQNRQVGRRLVEPALSWLGGDKEVWLGVVPYNHRAIKFFESLGFKKSGKDVEHDEPTFPNGKQLPEIEMIKQVNI